MGKSKWIKKGDRVLVIAGNDKGNMGEVLSRKGDRILVQGINIRKKHQKQQQQNVPASIISIEAAVHISNVHLCDADGKKIFYTLKNITLTEIIECINRCNE